MLDHLLIQFAKFPRLGKVKTRLAPDIGEPACLELHCQLMQHTHDVLKQTSQSLGGGLSVLSIDQQGEHPLVNALANHTQVIVQNGNDLGERMANAIDWGLTQARKVIIVGSDCPAMTPAHLHDAINALNDEAHVFIQAEDGGYVLVGATQPCNDLFTNVPWGSGGVMSVTKTRLRESKKTAALLGPLWDVDRHDDYQRLLTQFPDWPK